MLRSSKYHFHFILLGISLLVAFVLNLSLGSVSIPFIQVLKAFFGSGAEKESWNYILLNYRLPKSVTAIVSGAGLSISGLMMQTLFRNPLAGPYVLGISSGAGLGVAIVILGAGTVGGLLGIWLSSPWSLVLASGMGSFLVLLAVMAVSYKVKDTMAILIIGLMFGTFTTAVVSVLSYFSNAEQLQQYVFWSFGSLGNLSWNQVGILTLCFFIGLILCIATGKSLNTLLLGENYARSMGLHIKKTTVMIILSTSILAGVVTAFAGPIAFIGLAVPHLVRQVFHTSDHFVLIPAVLITGSLLMLLCDTVAQMPFSTYTLPINAITSIVGAPVVIWLLVRKKKLFF